MELFQWAGKLAQWAVRLAPWAVTPDAWAGRLAHWAGAAPPPTEGLGVSLFVAIFSSFLLFSTFLVVSLTSCFR